MEGHRKGRPKRDVVTAIGAWTMRAQGYLLREIQDRINTIRVSWGREPYAYIGEPEHPCFRDAKKWVDAGEEAVAYDISIPKVIEFHPEAGHFWHNWYGEWPEPIVIPPTKYIRRKTMGPCRPSRRSRMETVLAWEPHQEQGADSCDYTTAWYEVYECSVPFNECNGSVSVTSMNLLPSIKDMIQSVQNVPIEFDKVLLSNKNGAKVGIGYVGSNPKPVLVFQYAVVGFLTEDGPLTVSEFEFLKSYCTPTKSLPVSSLSK